MWCDRSVMGLGGWGWVRAAGLLVGLGGALRLAGRGGFPWAGAGAERYLSWRGLF